jgi:malate/lactate dehydrogenase
MQQLDAAIAGNTMSCYSMATALAKILLYIGMDTNRILNCPIGEVCEALSR